MLNREDIYAWAAPKFNVNKVPEELRGRPVFFFNIQNAVKRMWKDRGRPDYVEATRRAWSVSPKWRNKEKAIAIGLVF